jgi:nucleoside-diphosphate-sugar epimerase
MRIFVTGASGYIGQAVAKAFRNKGHTVYGLVRSEEDANLLKLMEILPIIGDFNQPETFEKILDNVEVAVNCAFDYSDQGVERDANTIDLIIRSFSKKSLPTSFIYTSGVWVYGSRGHEIVDESTPVNPIEKVKWRPEHEKKVLDASSKNLKTVVIRPGFVYGLNGGLLKVFFAASQNGTVPMIGEGHNRWPMVHVNDLAHAYVSAAEKELNGVILNVVDDSNPTMKEIVEAIARCAKIEGKIQGLNNEEAQKILGALWEGMAIDLKVDNSRIKRLLKWQIHHAPFLNEAETYFQSWKASQETENF